MTLSIILDLDDKNILFLKWTNTIWPGMFNWVKVVGNFIQFHWIKVLERRMLFKIKVVVFKIEQSTLNQCKRKQNRVYWIKVSLSPCFSHSLSLRNTLLLKLYKGSINFSSSRGSATPLARYSALVTKVSGGGAPSRNGRTLTQWNLEIKNKINKFNVLCLVL